MKQISLISASIAFMGYFVCPAHGQNLISNGSFETGNYTYNSNGADGLPVGSNAITGWTTVSAELTVMENGNAYHMSSEDGNVSLDLTGYHDSAPYGGVEQTISTVAGQEYSLQFWIGVQNDVGPYAAPVSVDATIGDGNATTFTNDMQGSGEQWYLATENFVATGSTTTIDLIGSYTQGGQYIGLDNVSVEAVPAPSGMIALGLGILSLACLKFRKA